MPKWHTFSCLFWYASWGLLLGRWDHFLKDVLGEIAIFKMPIFRFVANCGLKMDPKTDTKRHWFLDRILHCFFTLFWAPRESQGRVRPGPAGMGRKANDLFLSWSGSPFYASLCSSAFQKMLIPNIRAVFWPGDLHGVLPSRFRIFSQDVGFWTDS